MSRMQMYHFFYDLWNRREIGKSTERKEKKLEEHIF